MLPAFPSQEFRQNKRPYPCNPATEMGVLVHILSKSPSPRAYRRRGHATPHMPVETAKCWWLLKIEPNAWADGKGSCAVCVDLQAVGALEFFGEFYGLAKGFGPFLRGFWAGFREREGSIFSNHQHFAVSTGICGVACPLLLYAIAVTGHLTAWW